jgi:hypothetical protein
MLSYNIAEEKVEYLIQSHYEDEIVVPYNRGMDEEELQQPVNDNNKNKIQQQICNNVRYQIEDRLDMEIEEMRMLIMKVSQRRHTELKNIYISRENGKSQATTIHQDNKTTRKAIHNIKFGT